MSIDHATGSRDGGRSENREIFPQLPQRPYRHTVEAADPYGGGIREGIWEGYRAIGHI